MFVVIAQGTSAGAQLDYFLRTLLTPAGLAALGAFIVALVAVAVAPKLKWFVLAGLLYAGSLGFPGELLFRVPFVAPLQALRTNGRGLSAACLVLLLVPALFTHAAGWRRRVVLGGTVVFLVFQLVVCARILAAGLADRAATSLPVYLITFGVLAFGLSRWLHTMDDVRATFRAAAGCAVLLLAGTLVQLAINRTAPLINGRLYGTTSNPQFLGSACALLLPPVLYLMLQRTEPKWWRLALGAVAGFLVLFLAWTGSRTAAVMALVGLGLTFRLRIGRLLGAGIVCGIFVLVAVQLFAESSESAGRLLSMQDTRSGVWLNMLGEFFAHPLAGVIEGRDIAVSENSYLAVASRVGLIGLVPMMTALALIGLALYRLQRLRRYLGDDALAADVVTAGIVSLAVGSMFDGYLLGTISFQLFYFQVALAIAAFLLDYAEQTAWSSAPAEPGHGFEVVMPEDAVGAGVGYGDGSAAQHDY